jgi:hypothetical protein
VLQEVDVVWQLLRRSYAVQGDLVWNPSKMKLFEPEFLVKNSERCLFETVRGCIIFCMKEKDVLE